MKNDRRMEELFSELSKLEFNRLANWDEGTDELAECVFREFQLGFLGLNEPPDGRKPDGKNFNALKIRFKEDPAFRTFFIEVLFPQAYQFLLNTLKSEPGIYYKFKDSPTN